MHELKSILIIEDDPVFGHRLSEQLKSKCENLTLVDTAERGTYFLTSHVPDIIFLDNILPKLNGVEVLTMFKQISPTSKIVLLSSDYRISDVASAIQQKVDYVLDKEGLTNEKIEDIVNDIISEKGNDRLFKFKNPFKIKLSNKKKVTVIEDDELFSLQLVNTIEKHFPDLETNSFNNFNDFQNYVVDKSGQPDTIFLDYSLPDSNGAEILRFIKDHLPKAKVIVISSMDSTKNAIELNDIGIENYIMKDEEWKSKLVETLKRMELSKP